MDFATEQPITITGKNHTFNNDRLDNEPIQQRETTKMFNIRKIGKNSFRANMGPLEDEPIQYRSLEQVSSKDVRLMQYV